MPARKGVRELAEATCCGLTFIVEAVKEKKSKVVVHVRLHTRHFEERTGQGRGKEVLGAANVVAVLGKAAVDTMHLFSANTPAIKPMTLKIAKQATLRVEVQPVRFIPIGA